MRQIIINEFITLDGVIQAPGDKEEDTEGGFQGGGWAAPYMQDHMALVLEGLDDVGAYLLGRVTFDIFASYWPTVTDESDRIAGKFNTLPKYVASTTLKDPAWKGTTVLGGDVPGELGALKQSPGKDIHVIGSSGLAQTLMAHGLVDKYRLVVHPVVVGGGKRLFRAGGPATDLRLDASRTMASGLVILTYRAAQAA